MQRVLHLFRLAPFESGAHALRDGIPGRCSGTADEVSLVRGKLGPREWDRGSADGCKAVREDQEEEGGEVGNVYLQ